MRQFFTIFPNQKVTWCENCSKTILKIKKNKPNMTFAQLSLCCWLKFGSRKELKKTTIRPKRGAALPKPSRKVESLFVTKTCERLPHKPAKKGSLRCLEGGDMWLAFHVFLLAFLKVVVKTPVLCILYCFMILDPSKFARKKYANHWTIDSWWMNFLLGILLHYLSFGSGVSHLVELLRCKNHSKQSGMKTRLMLHQRSSIKKQQKWYKKASMWHIL